MSVHSAQSPVARELIEVWAKAKERLDTAEQRMQTAAATGFMTGAAPHELRQSWQAAKDDLTIAAHALYGSRPAPCLATREQLARAEAIHRFFPSVEEGKPYKVEDLVHPAPTLNP